MTPNIGKSLYVEILYYIWTQLMQNDFLNSLMG